MEIQLDDHGAFTLARIHGELRTADTEQFIETMMPHVSGAGSALAVDLSQVTTIDSRGLSALIQLVTRSRLAQGQVAIVAPSPFVRSVLNVTRLDQWFDIFADLDGAERHFVTG